MADADVGGIGFETATVHDSVIWKEKSPMSDLLYVERIISTVQYRLERMEADALDVEVAARCRQLSRHFPTYFLGWAAAQVPGKVTQAAAGEDLKQPVQRACEEIPLLANINKLDEVKNVALDKMVLPPICIEALVLVNAGLPKTEGDQIHQARMTKQMTEQLQHSFQKEQERSLQEQMQRVAQMQEKAFGSFTGGMMGRSPGIGYTQSPHYGPEKGPLPESWGRSFLRKFGL